MIIITIIILYFIQIRHTDYLPSTGTGLVFLMTGMVCLFASRITVTATCGRDETECDRRRPLYDMRTRVSRQNHRINLL